MLPFPALDVTVWCAESLLVQTTVLLVPIATLIVAGE
jgi:hypothetical protein